MIGRSMNKRFHGHREVYSPPDREDVILFQLGSAKPVKYQKQHRDVVNDWMFDVAWWMVSGKDFSPEPMHKTMVKILVTHADFIVRQKCRRIREICTSKIQCLAAAALWLSWKLFGDTDWHDYEIGAEFMVEFTNKSYTVQDIIEMERNLIRTTQWWRTTVCESISVQQSV